MAGDSDSKSPQTTNATVSRPDTAADPKEQSEIVAKTEQPGAEAAKPLAPPPRPSDKAAEYFSLPNAAGSLNQEPNPFEKSFSGGGSDPVLGAAGAPVTPGGTKLPPVASITSPSSLLPGTGTTPFNWPGGSLRTGPLSPAMLSGPQGDYFSDQFRGGFPTPNESSLRTGLTPGGSGSMFPSGVPSPGTAALFGMGGSGATPGAVDFHRTAMRAAAEAREHQGQASLPATSQPQGMNGAPGVKSEMKSESFSGHDNEAAIGLFSLAQGRNGVSQQSQYPVPPQPAGAHSHPAPPVQHPDAHLNGNGTHGTVNVRGSSEAASEQSENGSEHARPNTRGKKRSGGPASANGRRKADEAPAKGPANKKAKTNGAGASSVTSDDMGDEEEHDDGMGEGKSKHKMTEEEKRKNFLERNRVAALKCRQRKKQWLANLQTKVDVYQQENDSLQQQIAGLREEVVNLKTLLLAHKDCPVTQQQGLQGAYMPGMEPYSAQMNPYGMAGAIGSHQMIPAQGGQRRFS